MNLELVLDPVPRASGVARRWVRDRLQGLDDGDLSDNVELLTTEVVTNALLHAATPIRLTLRVDGQCIRVDVHDESTNEPVPRRPATTATIGWGLAILDQLADSWGWTITSPGKNVWFVVCPQSAVRDGLPAAGETAPERPGPLAHATRR